MSLKAMIKLIVVVADHQSLIEETGGDHKTKGWSIGKVIVIQIIEDTVVQKLEGIWIQNLKVTQCLEEIKTMIQITGKNRIWNSEEIMLCILKIVMESIGGEIVNWRTKGIVI